MPSATTAGQAIWCRRSAMAQRAASCAWLTSVARLPQARRGRYSRTGSYCSHSATDSRFPPQGVTVRRVNCQAVPKHATLLQSPRKFLRLLCTHTDGGTSLKTGQERRRSAQIRCPRLHAQHILCARQTSLDDGFVHTYTYTKGGPALRCTCNAMQHDRTSHSNLIANQRT